MKIVFFIRRVLSYISYRVGIYEVFHHREVAWRSFCLVVLSLRKFINFQPFHQEKCAEKHGCCQLSTEIRLTGWRERLNVQMDVAFPAKRPSVEMLPNHLSDLWEEKDDWTYASMQPPPATTIFNAPLCFASTKACVYRTFSYLCISGFWLAHNCRQKV